MPIALNDIPLLDDEQIEMLREALDADELSAMFSELPSSAQNSLAAIEAAVAGDDLDRARREAHVLKGVASSFGAARLASIAGRIELEVTTIDAAAAWLPLLAVTVGKTVAALPGAATPTLVDAIL